MAFESGNPSLRETEFRKGEFREAARDIVWKDRNNKKLGRSVDTGGAIARALESAYKLGLAHGQGAMSSTLIGPEKESVQPHGNAIAWNTIPPRPRAIFERILYCRWIVILMLPNPSPWLKQSDKWACYWDWGDRRSEDKRYELAHTFSRSTLMPLVRLGLMEERLIAGRTILEKTALADATWEAAIAAGHVNAPT